MPVLTDRRLDLIDALTCRTSDARWSRADVLDLIAEVGRLRGALSSYGDLR